jgi:hypothetical protein
LKNSPPPLPQLISEHVHFAQNVCFIGIEDMMTGVLQAHDMRGRHAIFASVQAAELVITLRGRFRGGVP